MRSLQVHGTDSWQFSILVEDSHFFNDNCAVDVLMTTKKGYAAAATTSAEVDSIVDTRPVHFKHGPRIHPGREKCGVSTRQSSSPFWVHLTSVRACRRFYVRLFHAAVPAGIALVIVNTMLDNLSEDLTFEKNVGGAAVSSIFYVGAMLGGLVAGPFEKASGKFAQLWIGVLYACGNIIAGLTADHKFCWGGPFDGCVTSMLFAARILTGFALGLMLVVSPKYDMAGEIFCLISVWPGIWQQSRLQRYEEKLELAPRYAFSHSISLFFIQCRSWPRLLACSSGCC